MNKFPIFKNESYSNIEKLKFYQKANAYEFRKLARICGIDDYCDIKQLIPYLKNKKSILEIGGGYGRVLKGLEHYGLFGNISTIEIIPKLASKLRTKFSNITVYERNINYDESFLSLPYFDAALIMWGTILDFSKIEQEKLIKNVMSKLNNNGIFAIDLPYFSNNDPFAHYDEANEIISKKEKTFTFYFPTEREMEVYAEKACAKISNKIIYESAHKSKRSIYILSK